jgi:hypothetical protein
MNTSVIPASELASFMQLPAAVQADIEAWQDALSSVTKPIKLSLQAIAARFGVSCKTARRKYDEWRKGRNGAPPRHWRSLVNLCKVREESTQSPDFVEYWKGLCESNGRKCAPAYRQFVREFKEGKLIPGIDPAISRKQIPAGYSYDNLMRYRPTDFELEAARIGRSAAAACRPKLFTSRKDLAVGRGILFDDMWHDMKICMVGQRRSLRLLQLHAHDLFSACQFARGLKPRIEEPDGTRVNLHESEMLFLVAHVLTEFGFHPDGTVLFVEHGTAAIHDDLEKLLFDLSNGKITVERSGIEGYSSFAGQYAGRSKGNFRLKAALESLGNLIHNETANLIQFPGQTGSNSRLNLPEELHGRDRHFDTLQRAIIAMITDGVATAERVAMLRMPFVEFNQARWMIEELMERINRRSDHDLEGWLEAGLTTMDMDIPGIGLMPAQSYLALPPEKQAAVSAIATPVPRKMSPREVCDAGRRRLIRFRPEQSARVLHSITGREVIVGSDHLIEFEDQTISPSPLRYLAHHWSPGEKFTAVVNPMSPNVAHLFDARGAWLGIVQAWQTVSQLDAEALHRQMGEAARIEKQLLAPLAKRGAQITRQREADARHNAAVLDTSKPLTAGEKASAKFIKRESAAAADDILSPTSPNDSEKFESVADELLNAISKPQP